jgi:hypothetical protein
VGFTASAARYNVDGVDEVRRLLEDLAGGAQAPGAAQPELQAQ